MFNVNDFIVYNSQYVCEVDNISVEENKDGVQKYYNLTPLSENNCKIKIPVNSTKVSMRKVISNEEAKQIIYNIPNINHFWFEDKSERAKHYRDALRSGKCTEWAKVFKTLTSKKKERGKEGKKLSNADESALKMAESLLGRELSVSLGVPYPQIISHIQEKFAVNI